MSTGSSRKCISPMKIWVESQGRAHALKLHMKGVSVESWLCLLGDEHVAFRQTVMTRVRSNTDMASILPH